MSLDLWEKFENFKFNDYRIIKKGLLRNDQGKLFIYRDNESRLLLKAEGNANVQDFNFKDKTGKVEREEILIEFKHKYLDQKILVFALPINRILTQSNGENIYVDIYLVDEFEFIDSHSSIGAEYLIEFVDGLKIDHIFPHSMKMNEIHEKKYELYGANLEFIQKIINQNNSTRNSIKFEVEGNDVFIIKLDNEDKGVILYRTNLDTGKREKIISYILGCPLIYFGYTFVNKYFAPSYSYLKNISTNESSLLKINFQLPIPLSLNALNVIESHFFQNLLNEFYAKYEEYDLGNIFFTYWIAVNSNSITAAVHYGALIEKLQAKYMKIQDVSYSKILDKSVFKKMRKQLEGQVEAFELTDEQKEIFLNKIGNMNTYSQKDKMDFFCNDISLLRSDIEKLAWQQRNDAAHGNDISDINQAWKNTIILKELVNKFLLKLLTSSKFYISYLEGSPIIKRI